VFLVRQDYMIDQRTVTRKKRTSNF